MGQRYDRAVADVTRKTMRDIAGAAVREELTRVALDLFHREGFDKVTVNRLAAEAGVSRSTILRYFGSKEDIVLGAFDAHGARIADAVRARPADEDDWTALRRGLDPITDIYRKDPADALATTYLVRDSPVLWAGQREKQHSWRPVLAQALAERGGAPRPSPLAMSVLAAAALTCLEIAVSAWAASRGERSLVDILDEAFAALAPVRGH